MSALAIRTVAQAHADLAVAQARLVERLAAHLRRVPALRSARRPARLSEHLLRDVGLTAAEWDGLWR